MYGATEQAHMVPSGLSNKLLNAGPSTSSPIGFIIEPMCTVFEFMYAVTPISLILPFDVDLEVEIQFFYRDDLVEEELDPKYPVYL